MSSGFRPLKTQYTGLSYKHGASATQIDRETLGATAQPEGATGETNGSHLPLTFNTLTLEKLSMELEKCTKETLKLQEELENTTRVMLVRFDGAPNTTCKSNVCGAPVHNQGLDHSLDNSDQQLPPRVFSSLENKEFENAIDDCLQQLTNLELEKSEQQKAYIFEDSIIDLQTKLHQIQMEKEIVSDLRLKDSKKHVEEMEKMLHILEEVQVTKRYGDQRQQKTEEEALALNRKIETLEQILKDYHTQFFREVQQWPNNTAKANDETGLRHLHSSAKEDYNEESERYLNKNGLSRKHLLNEERNTVNEQKERVGQLIDCLSQEMAMLSDKLNSSKSDSVSLSLKLELLKKLAERCTLLHEAQVFELEKTLSSHENKVCFLEQHLTHVYSQLLDAQREKARILTQAVELKEHFNQIKVCSDQQQCKFQEEVKTLRGQLETAREQLRRTEEQKTCLQALLEQKTQEGRKSQELLEEKRVDLEFRQQEAQQHMALLDEARDQCQKLHTEAEVLRIKLEDKEKMIDILRVQLDSSIQKTEENSNTIDNLHQENSLLSNKLNQHKLEILHLRAELDHHKSSLAAVEHKRCQLQASVAEHSHRVQEETLAKQQLTIQLEQQHFQLLTLTEEHKELQQIYSCKNKENEGVVLKLQSHLKNVQAELDKVRSTLRTLEGTDGHGVQVALSMQKEITARRKQIDSLQSKIQHLEETKGKLCQEKLNLNLKNKHHLQELALNQMEKQQLAKELEAVQSKDKQLRKRICELEEILHKMSERLADCQDFIQLQEQAFYRLKLRHALDLKECHSQNPGTALNNGFLKTKTQQGSPTSDHRSLNKDLQGVISEKHRPHTNPTSSIHRRRSAPESVQRTAFSTDKTEAMCGIGHRRKHCGSESHHLKTTELNRKMHYNSFSQEPLTSTPTAATSSPQLLPLGRRSPVHSLLTSDPNS